MVEKSIVDLFHEVLEKTFNTELPNLSPEVTTKPMGTEILVNRDGTDFRPWKAMAKRYVFGQTLTAFSQWCFTPSGALRKARRKLRRKIRGYLWS